MNVNKLCIENWTDCYMDPCKKEGEDYVLVSHKIWDILKDTFGGGPTIQFFLTDSEDCIEKYHIQKDNNFLYQQPYKYGYPDKNPNYFNLTLSMKDGSSNSTDTLKFPYRVMLSNSMTPKSILYYFAKSLLVDVYKLSLDVVGVDENCTELAWDNDGITLAEIISIFSYPELVIRYNGTSGKLS